MSTIAQAIKNRLKVEGETVVPNRSEEETKKICDSESLLDKEFNEIKDLKPYTSTQLTDLAGKGESSEVEAEEAEKDLDPGLIGHTDAIRIGGKTYSVVVAKTATEVLNLLKEGIYMAVSFQINISKLDGGSLETGLRNFRPRAANLPRSRKSTRLEGNLVVVEPNINGFKISVFVEDLDDANYKALCNLNNWIEEYQGALLESVLLELQKMGVPVEALAKSQSSLGVIPKARRLFESKVAREGEGETNATPVITKDIRIRSRAFANELNDALGLEPLTNTTIEFGLQVYTVQVTTNSEVIQNWKSQRSNFSYFSKGEVAGRTNRLTGSKRKIPVTQTSLPGVLSKLESLIPSVLTTFENIARSQLGYKLVEAVPLPPAIRCQKKNINELFDLAVSVTYAYQQEYMTLALAELDKRLKTDEARQIRSLMESYIQASKRED